MPEEQAAHHAGSGIGKLLQAQTAGLPNWAWLLIIAGGIVAAVVVPNLLASNQAASTTDTTGTTTPTDGTTGNVSSTPDLSSLLGGGGGGSIPSSGGYVATPTTDGTVGAATTTAAPPAVAPTTTPAISQLQTQNAMQAAAQTPPTTAPSGTPLSNMQKIVNYLAGLGTGATVNQVGTAGHPQSGYVVTGNGVNAVTLGHLFSGWSVVKCGTNKYLVKGPGATNVHFGANCTVTGYA